MKLVFKGQAFEFDPEDMNYPDGIAFEHETGMSVGQYLDGMRSGSLKCIVASAWFARWCNGERSLTFADMTADPELRPLKDIQVEDGEPADPTEAEFGTTGT